MIDQFVLAMHTPLSALRLERYWPKTDPAPNLSMLANYYWNMDLAEALFPSLHAVEVALRNTVNAAYITRYKTHEWWFVPYALEPNQYNDAIAIGLRYQKDHGQRITPPRMVSRLDFGFWTTVLSPGTYTSRIWSYKRYFLVDQAFPNRGNFKLADIHQRFNDIRLLRNRVMHHEPIFDRTDLAQEHADIHEAIKWISPELHQGIHIVDDFPDVHQRGWERAYERLHRMLGGP